MGCAHPVVARDGTLVFQEKGARGAAIVTANGLEYHDRVDVPQRVVTRDPNDPWHAPIGFILPADGKLTKTSHPTVLATPGLAFALRPSDTRVPAWGGEVLVRIDVRAPAAPGEARPAERVALVLDGAGEQTLALAGIALGQLGGTDHVFVIDTAGDRVVVPPMPASDMSLVLAAIEKRVADRARPAANLGAAVDRARTMIGQDKSGRIIVLSDGSSGTRLTSGARSLLVSLAQAGLPMAVVATAAGADAEGLRAIAADAAAVLAVEPSLEDRERTLRSALPPAGLVVFHDVVLTFAGTPAPSHVLEASGGDVRWRLDSGELALGDVYAGQVRTEVVRVTVPAWVSGESFKFTVTGRFDDVEGAGKRRAVSAEVPCIYDEDIERIAKSRHGDVIAYASALATLRRLDAAFVGEGVAREGGLLALAQLHARSMALLARDMHDPSIAEQAELLEALLAAIQ
jgi:hypothetical protein